MFISISTLNHIFSFLQFYMDVICFLIVPSILWTGFLGQECAFPIVPFFCAVSFLDSYFWKEGLMCILSFFFFSYKILNFSLLFFLSRLSSRETRTLYLIPSKKQCFSQASVLSPTLFQELVLWSKPVFGILHLVLEFLFLLLRGSLCASPEICEPLSFFSWRLLSLSHSCSSTCRLAGKGSLMEFSLFLNLQVVWRPWYSLSPSIAEWMIKCGFSYSPFCFYVWGRGKDKWGDSKSGGPHSPPKPETGERDSWF